MSEFTVINLNEKKKEIIENKRREFERVLFKQLLGVYCFLEENSTPIPITLIDLSKKGMLMQSTLKNKNFFQEKINEIITIRLYFSSHSYLPVKAFVKHITDYEDKTGIDSIRIGLELDESSSNYHAIDLFTQFIFEYAQHSIIDKDKSIVI